MDRIRVGLLTLALVSWVVPVAALEDAPPQESDSATEPDLTQALAPFLHPLAVEEGRLAGPGAELLAREAGRSHFFLLGEQHATVEIAQLATALFRSLTPLGYRRAAIEVGPVGARLLERLLRDEDPDALADYFATGTNLLSIPFFFFREEAEFARTVVEAGAAPGPALWGIDQEFIAGGLPALDRLGELAASEGEEDAVAAARELAAANPMFVGAGPVEPLEELAAAFASSDSQEARSLVGQLVVSNRIYRPFTGRGGTVYEANLERETLMKRLFLERYQEAEAAAGAPPRVFVKLGANHVFRGLSPTHVPSLGNFLLELAVARGLETYDLHVDCLGGVALDVMSGEGQPCESYFLGADSALAGALPEEGMVLVDLRGLRAEPALLARLDDSSRRLVWAFDGYVAIRDPRPATLFAGTRPSFGG